MQLALPRPQSKFWRGVMIGPAWPLIWMQLGLKLQEVPWHSRCGACGAFSEGCYERAVKMKRWYTGEDQE